MPSNVRSHRYCRHIQYYATTSLNRVVYIVQYILRQVTAITDIGQSNIVQLCTLSSITWVSSLIQNNPASMHKTHALNQSFSRPIHVPYPSCSLVLMCFLLRSLNLLQRSSLCSLLILCFLSHSLLLLLSLPSYSPLLPPSRTPYLQHPEDGHGC